MMRFLLGQAKVAFVVKVAIVGLADCMLWGIAREKCLD